MLWILLCLKKLIFLVCPPGLLISVFPSVPNRTKKASLFPSSTDACDDGISCIPLFSAEVFRIFKEKCISVLGSPLSNARIEV